MNSGLINTELVKENVRLKITLKDSKNRRNTTTWTLNHLIWHRNTPDRDSQSSAFISLSNLQCNACDTAPWQCVTRLAQYSNTNTNKFGGAWFVPNWCSFYRKKPSSSTKSDFSRSRHCTCRTQPCMYNMRYGSVCVCACVRADFVRASCGMNKHALSSWACFG